MRDDPLRPRVTKRDADAHDGFRVIPADLPGDDVTLLGTQPGTFLSRRTAGEVRHRRAGYQDRTDRREDAAFAQRADDPSNVTRRKELLRGLDDEHAALKHARIEREPPSGEDPFDDLQATTPRPAGH
jgi:hypothetical protein